MKLGLYQHYKGNFYHVLGVGNHEETHEELVIYRALYGDFRLWVRPQTIFCETINHENQTVERYKFIRSL